MVGRADGGVGSAFRWGWSRSPPVLSPRCARRDRSAARGLSARAALPVRTGPGWLPRKSARWLREAESALSLPMSERWPAPHPPIGGARLHPARPRRSPPLRRTRPGVRHHDRPVLQFPPCGSKLAKPRQACGSGDPSLAAGAIPGRTARPPRWRSQGRGARPRLGGPRVCGRGREPLNSAESAPRSAPSAAALRGPLAVVSQLPRYARRVCRPGCRSVMMIVTAGKPGRVYRIMNV